MDFQRVMLLFAAAGSINSVSVENGTGFLRVDGVAHAAACYTNGLLSLPFSRSMDFQQ